MTLWTATQCREALSARLDGEESPAERDAIAAHLTGCAACRRFADEAARVTRLSRTAVATQAPDVVGVLTAQSADHSSHGVKLEGASIAHFANESAAWNLALGVGFLWVARRSGPTSGMVPTLATFVAVLAALVVLDVAAGRVDPERFLVHGLVLLGLILVLMLDRLPRPTGGIVPGASAVGLPWSRSSRRADPALGTDAAGLPSDLRPTAQHDNTAIAQRRTA